MARNKDKSRPANVAKEFFSTGISSRSTDPTKVAARTHEHDPLKDDLINFLSASRENRRARQVFEWETARRNSVAEAA
ncbi:MAG: hypothetical protein DWQ47_17255 [Acidobacteria bacterium]|nr:MAG: hypothetical protein DWQ32_04655 [Acidobacteriota bacterium]REK02211.1 MAG: hypothetical protein DWQ38_07495 [Acidobacteriota bacterium]REK13986.1 MAG: hypothetical protein DWQ43_10345 [Acidobacteriota bacterium]REK41981.1 MAG: hypothetical protein DWQ47_17255 [Acidobacteriota bacterium]